MVTRGKESELILNADGSIYHLQLRPEHVTPTVILVGDPQRVTVFSSRFDVVHHRISNREFVTHSGEYKGVPMMVIGTGIGTDNIDIVLNELDALVNIDLNSGYPREDVTSLRLVRVGTTGLLQPDIEVGSFIASSWGLGLDSLMHFYDTGEDVLDSDLARAVSAHSEWNHKAGDPYAVKASQRLITSLAADMIQGITLTAPGFYGPQGRVLRLRLASPGFVESLSDFSYQGKRILNFEMETSALYGLAGMLGHEALTVCVAVANRATGAFLKDYKGRISQLADLVLDRLAHSDS